MKINKLPFIVAAISTGLLATLLFTGASSKERAGPWEISAKTEGLYIMDQSTGDIYFMEDDPKTVSNRAKIRKLGNISRAR